MGKTAEEVKEQIDDLDDDEKQRLEDEANANKTEEELKAKEEADVKAEVEAKAKEDAETELREKLETEGKTEEEIEAAILEAAEEGQELEIVREGKDTQSFDQQQVDSIVTKRVDRLNKKLEKSGDAADSANTELALEKERTKLLEIALDAAKQKKTEASLVAPDPSEFDDGLADPEFIKKQGEYNSAVITAEVSRQVAEATKTTVNETVTTEKSKDLHVKQLKHYERANEIGAKDYGATEDIAIDILGENTVNIMIDSFEDSHIVLYYLGKNPAEAETIRDLLKTKPILGIDAIANLRRDLKLKPKGKVTPNPDEEVQGDGVQSNKRGPKGAIYT